MLNNIDNNDILDIQIGKYPTNESIPALITNLLNERDSSELYKELWLSDTDKIKLLESRLTEIEVELKTTKEYILDDIAQGAFTSDDLDILTKTMELMITGCISLAKEGHSLRSAKIGPQPAFGACLTQLGMEIETWHET